VVKEFVNERLIEQKERLGSWKSVTKGNVIR